MEDIHKYRVPESQIVSGYSLRESSGKGLITHDFSVPKPDPPTSGLSGLLLQRKEKMHSLLENSRQKSNNVSAVPSVKPSLRKI
jgi:hypothetical protein